jgi:hypothetical protein
MATIWNVSPKVKTLSKFAFGHVDFIQVFHFHHLDELGVASIPARLSRLVKIVPKFQGLVKDSIPTALQDLRTRDNKELPLAYNMGARYLIFASGS